LNELQTQKDTFERKEREVSSQYDKDMTLWEAKNTFLEQQRE